MCTIRPLTDDNIASLRAEPQGHVGRFDMGTGDLIPSVLLYGMLPFRIVHRIEVVGNCWRVKGWNTGNGFANMRVRGRTHKVHRVVYTLLVRPIPEGHLLDHKKDAGCQYRDCCNLGHLEPVTTKINNERGMCTYFPKKEAKYA